MAYIVEKNDVCDICGEKCREAYWIEVKTENNDEKDCFVCEICYHKIKKE